MPENMADERVVLITGAAGGIGVATVAAFLDSGWRVVAVDRVEGMELPPGTAFEQVNLREVEEVADLSKRLHEDPGRLDAVVNNAAVQFNNSVEETSAAEWDLIMETNLRAAFLMAKHNLDLLARSRGSVVNVSSVHALATSLNIAAYAASKGGMLALTRAMALELGGRGVRVNAVLPGAVDTSMLRASVDRLEGGSAETWFGSLAERTPLGRIGRPDEIAQAILFLADNQRSAFITGQALVVDGGATARLGTE